MLRRLLREPLLHFLLIGGALFALLQWRQQAQQRYVIEIDAGEQRRLTAVYAQQFGAAPTAAVLQRLIGQRAREEIMVREARALGLERDDEIIRRRLAQKYEFLQQDLAPAAVPTALELTEFYRLHAADYALPPRVTFTHVYFAADAGDAAAEARARAALARLQREPGVRRAPERGDRFADRYDYTALGPRELERLFGPSPLAESLPGAPAGRWSGPYRSGFGWHLVYVTRVDPARVPALSEIEARVREDWQRLARERANDAAFARVAARYRVHVAPAR